MKNRNSKNLIKASPEQAIKFLENFYPDGPWHLVSIVPDGRLTAKTFLPQEKGKLKKWLEDREGRENFYFHVNPLKADVKNKKARKTDVAIGAWLHVDVDDTAALDRLRAFSPKPTIVLFSGGGFQAFWRLSEPTKDLPLLEKINKALVENLGGDICFSADHLMRLPGTINLPTKKKRAKGRVPTEAKLLEAETNWKRSYPLSEFKHLLKSTLGVKASNEPEKISDIFPTDLDLTGLGEKEASLVVKVISKGPIPEHDFNGDRSDAVFYICCALIRADVSDVEILGVLLNKRNGISDHIYDRGGKDPLKYAQRQLQRALEKQPRPGPIVEKAPLDQAEKFKECCWPNLVHFREEFLAYEGGAYRHIANDTIRSGLYKFLNTCRVREGKGEDVRLVPFNPIPSKVSAVQDALAAITHIAPDQYEPPCWINFAEGLPPDELLVCKNGILHLPSREILSHTPNFFTRNAVPYEYDPKAAKPKRFLKFLNEVFFEEEEKDNISALQEFAGYLLCPDTSQQKALMLIGPKRSGKGTIGRIFTALIGPRNTASPSLNSFGRGFGLEPLIGKQLAIVSDARVGQKTDKAAVAENLLRITGEDQVDIDRKYKGALTMTLKIRFVIMTNYTPRWADASGALANRFIILQMHQSFFGREDPGLTQKLLGELPGILNWAIEGWDRVKRQGFILQPAAGEEAIQQMINLSSPIPAFVEEECILGPEFFIEKSVLFEKFRRWHEEKLRKPSNYAMEYFSRDLLASVDGVRAMRKVVEEEKRVPVYKGIKIKPPPF